MSHSLFVPPIVPRLLTLAALVAWTVVACGPSQNSSSSDVEIDADRFEVACELALVRLERLINDRAADMRVSEAILIEARELHRLGRELYLEREYILALEMLQDGMKLLEEKGADDPH